MYNDSEAEALWVCLLFVGILLLMYGSQEKQVFCAKLNSILDQCPPWNTLNVLSDFSATIRTSSIGYAQCVDPHNSQTRNTNDPPEDTENCKIQKVEWQILDIKLEMHHWTWYNNARKVTRRLTSFLKIFNERSFRTAVFLTCQILLQLIIGF